MTSITLRHILYSFTSLGLQKLVQDPEIPPEVAEQAEAYCMPSGQACCLPGPIPEALSVLFIDESHFIISRIKPSARGYHQRGAILFGHGLVGDREALDALEGDPTRLFLVDPPLFFDSDEPYIHLASASIPALKIDSARIPGTDILDRFRRLFDRPELQQMACQLLTRMLAGERVALIGRPVEQADWPLVLYSVIPPPMREGLGVTTQLMMQGHRRLHLAASANEAMIEAFVSARDATVHSVSSLSDQRNMFGQLADIIVDYALNDQVKWIRMGESARELRSPVGSRLLTAVLLRMNGFPIDDPSLMKLVLQDFETGDTTMRERLCRRYLPLLQNEPWDLTTETPAMTLMALAQMSRSDSSDQVKTTLLAWLGNEQQRNTLPKLSQENRLIDAACELLDWAGGVVDDVERLLALTRWFLHHAEDQIDIRRILKLALQFAPPLKTTKGRELLLTLFEEKVRDESNRDLCLQAVENVFASIVDQPNTDNQDWTLLQRAIRLWFDAGAYAKAGLEQWKAASVNAGWKPALLFHLVWSAVHARLAADKDQAANVNPTETCDTPVEWRDKKIAQHLAEMIDQETSEAGAVDAPGTAVDLLGPLLRQDQLPHFLPMLKGNDPKSVTQWSIHMLDRFNDDKAAKVELWKLFEVIEPAISDGVALHYLTKGGRIWRRQSSNWLFDRLESDSSDSHVVDTLTQIAPDLEWDSKRINRLTELVEHRPSLAQGWKHWLPKVNGVNSQLECAQRIVAAAPDRSLVIHSLTNDRLKGWENNPRYFSLEAEAAFENLHSGLEKIEAIDPKSDKFRAYLECLLAQLKKEQEDFSDLKLLGRLYALAGKTPTAIGNGETTFREALLAEAIVRLAYLIIDQPSSSLKLSDSELDDKPLWNWWDGARAIDRLGQFINDSNKSLNIEVSRLLETLYQQKSWITKSVVLAVAVDRIGAVEDLTDVDTLIQYTEYLLCNRNDLENDSPRYRAIDQHLLHDHWNAKRLLGGLARDYVERGDCRSLIQILKRAGELSRNPAKPEGWIGARLDQIRLRDWTSNPGKFFPQRWGSTLCHVLWESYVALRQRGSKDSLANRQTLLDYLRLSPLYQAHPAAGILMSEMHRLLF